MAASGIPAGLYDDSDEEDGFLFGDEETFTSKDSKILMGSGSHGSKSNLGMRPDSSKITSTKLEDFRMAILQGSIKAAIQLIDEGANVNAEFSNGWSALMLAGNLARADIFKFLVEKGADVNHHKDLYTVLMATCGSNCQKTEVVDCVRLLVEKGADVNAHDRYHVTPLMYASREGRLEVVEFLLDNGAQINRQDSRGWTALSWATQRDKLGVVKLLLQKGADKDKKHLDNLTAIDLARGREEVIWLFENKTAAAPRGNEGGSGASSAAIGVAGDGDGIAAVSSGINTPAGLSVTDQKYGELDVFLLGLGLGHLREVFQLNQVDFPLLLTMNEEDLAKMGITQLGVRKKLVEAVAAVHKRNWENSSLVPIRFKSQVKCPDAIAIIANLSKHLRYITSSVVYISDHLKHDSDFLVAGQNGSGPKQLLGHTTDGLQNATKLQHELSKLHSLLVKELSNNDFSPPDLVTQKPKKKRRVRHWPLTLFFAASSALMIWKRDALIEGVQSVMDRVPSHFLVTRNV